MADTELRGNEEKKSLKAYEAEQGEVDTSVSFVNGLPGSEGGAGDIPRDSYVHLAVDNTQGEFQGLTRDELARYADDPYWVRVRWILLILFWVVWIAMLIAAIVIIVLAPKCPPRPNQEWFEKSPMYIVYPQSYKDSNGDGYGDLEGVHEKLGYIKDTLKMSSVYIKSLLSSSDFDNGINNFMAINPKLGTMSDFSDLVVSMHKKGMQILMDFVPHSSGKDHEWFKKSELRDEKYSDYYVWADNEGDQKNEKGDSLWTKSDTRNQYYLHQLSPDQPSLNLDNNDVIEELKKALLFWKSKKVDGFVIQGTPFQFQNLTAGTSIWERSADMIRTFRRLLEQDSDHTSTYKAMFISSKEPEHERLNKLLKHGDVPGADLLMNSFMTKITDTCDVACIKGFIKGGLAASDGNNSINWQMTCPESGRIASRVDGSLLKPLTILQFTLPGVSSVFYGDEIGMKNTQDDKVYSIMQWSNGDNAGFSSNSSWIPPNGDYQAVNIKKQEATGNEDNLLAVMSMLSGLKGEKPSMLWGEIDFIEAAGSSVVAFVRQSLGFPGFLVVINLGDGDSYFDYHTHNAKLVPSKGEVVAHTGDLSHHFKIGEEISLDNFILKQKQGIVFTWEWDAQNK